MNKTIAAILTAWPLIVEAADYTSFIKKWEGYEPVAYKDTRGNWTIGYGFNLSDSSAKAKLAAHGLNPQSLIRGGNISASKAEMLLVQEVAIAKVIARENFPSFDSHPFEVRQILVDLSYNLGENKVDDFVDFRAAIAKKDYKTAAAELVDSNWYSQVGKRSRNHVATLRSIVKPKVYRKK